MLPFYHSGASYYWGAGEGAESRPRKTHHLRLISLSKEAEAEDWRPRGEETGELKEQEFQKKVFCKF